MVNQKSLAGRHIVVTRPTLQSEKLHNLITTAGGIVISFPVLQILETQNIHLVISSLNRLSDFDLAIFISPNAVTHTMSLLPQGTMFPSHLQVATIGPSTKAELERLGVTHVIAPTHRFDSEALLDLPQFKKISGKKIAIFRGDSGRNLLGNELKKRGAQLEYVECYRRTRPNSDPQILLKYWANSELNGIIVTSSEGFRNLFEMVGKKGQQLLKTTPIFVPHERIQKTGYDLGLSEIILTAQGDEGIVTDLIKWFN